LRPQDSISTPFLVRVIDAMDVALVILLCNFEFPDGELQQRGRILQPFIKGEFRFYGTKVIIHAIGVYGGYSTKHFVNIRLPALHSPKAQTIGYGVFLEKSICAEASVVYPLIPPIPHRPGGNQSFDVSAELHIRQI